MRLKNKGFARVDGRGSGDHFLHFVYKLPTSLNAKQKELLKEFELEEEKKKSGKTTSNNNTNVDKNTTTSNSNESIFSKIKNTITGATTAGGKE